MIRTSDRWNLMISNHIHKELGCFPAPVNVSQEQIWRAWGSFPTLSQRSGRQKRVNVTELPVSWCWHTAVVGVPSFPRIMWLWWQPFYQTWTQGRRELRRCDSSTFLTSGSLLWGVTSSDSQLSNHFRVPCPVFKHFVPCNLRHVPFLYQKWLSLLVS